MQKKILATFLVLCFLIGMADNASAVYRDFKIGRLWDTFHDSCVRIWQRSWQIPYQGFMWWPANKGQHKPWVNNTSPHPICNSAGSYWIGASPWTDAAGNGLAKYVAEVGWWWNDETTVSIPRYIYKVGRRETPEVIVDGRVLTVPWPQAPGDLLDPGLVADQMIQNEVRTSIGVDILQKAYAYTNKNFQDIIMIDVTFTNTGNINLDEDIEIPGQVLTNTYFNYSIRPTLSREGHEAIGGMEWHCHEYAEYYGGNEGDSLKVFYAWDGDNKIRSPGVEDTGDPHQVTGEWLSPQYGGIVPVHADVSPGDPTNDPTRPNGARWWGYSAAGSTSKPDGISVMYDWMTLGHREPSWVNSGGSPTWEDGNPNWHGENQNSLYCSYGPFDMQPGEDYRIVWAEAVGGLSVENCIKYGAAYKAAEDAGTLDDFTWTNPTTGETHSGFLAKCALLATGKDSLFRTASRAKWLYEHNFNCPDPPMSPSLYVQSSGGKIIVEWGDEPESEPDPDTGVIDFEGYRLYRAIGAYDSTNWQLVYDGTGHIFEDSSVPRGVATYYYVTAYDDGTQNTFGLHPGEKLESSKFWSMTTSPAYVLKDAENSLSMVDVVPNPYNIHAAPFQYPSEPNKILFVNLTPTCTINIYTMTGDLVKTLEHTSGSGEEAWDQITDSNQYVVSGVYIYHITGDGSSAGDEVTGKFIIVR